MEFKEERKLIKKELENDSKFRNYINVFVFEENQAKSIPPQKNFIDALYSTDIYIGILGSTYGEIKENGLSSTEYEYEIYNSIGKKNSSYFFIKDMDEREGKVEEFIEKIKSNTSFKIFSNTVELIDEIKKSLVDYINQSLTYTEFDYRVLLDSSCDDIDNLALKYLFEDIDYEPIIRLLGNRSLEDILILLNLGEKDLSGNFHLNNAGALFLAKDTDKFNLEHEVKMVRFNGNTKYSMIDKCFTKSPIPILLREVEHFFYKNTKVGSVINGLRRINIQEYPFNSIREAIVNAIAHRDYDFKGSFIQFYIYDNRIEIISPGNLLYPLKVSNLKNIGVPVHRNKNICNLFSKTIFMEHVGSGINRMCEEMKRAGLAEPEFIDGNGFFKVVFWGPNGELVYPENFSDENTIDLSKLSLNDRQIKVLTKIVNENEKYSYERYSQEFDISISTAKRDLNALVDKGLISKNSFNKRNYFLSK